MSPKGKEASDIFPLEGNKTDWKPTDYLDFEQMNRIESTMQTVVDAAGDYGRVTFSFEIVTGRNERHTEWSDSFNRIENNILTVARFFDVEYLMVAKIDWKSLDPVSFMDMNRIENNILRLYSFIYGNLTNIKYCGQTIVGDEGVA